MASITEKLIKIIMTLCCTCILAPSTLALLSTYFNEGQERTRAVGYYGAVAGISASIGLVLGGFFADWLSWRVGFFINFPIGILLMFGAQKHLQETRRRAGQFDLAGAMSSTLSMGAIVFGLMRAATFGWSNSLTIMSLVVGVLLLIFLLFNEAHVAQPIMPLRLFASPERSGAYAARILFLGAMMGFWFFTTQLLQGVMGFSAFDAGLAFLPTTLVNFAAAMMVPRLTQWLGNGRLLAIGLMLALLGMLWLSRVTVESSYLFNVALPMIFIGLGQGCALSPLTVAGISGVEVGDAGAASGVVNVAHQLGGSLGLSILAVVFTHGVIRGQGYSGLAERISNTFVASSLMLVAALIIVLIFLVPKKLK